FGGELNLPIGDRFGLRGEIVWKRQHLVENDTSATPSAPVGDAILDGIAGYAEVWFWLWAGAGAWSASPPTTWSTSGAAPPSRSWTWSPRGSWSRSFCSASPLPSEGDPPG